MAGWLVQSATLVRRLTPPSFTLEFASQLNIAAASLRYSTKNAAFFGRIPSDPRKLASSLGSGNKQTNNQKSSSMLFVVRAVAVHETPVVMMIDFSS